VSHTASTAACFLEAKSLLLPPSPLLLLLLLLLVVEALLQLNAAEAGA
jgi:hypothetical protein